MKPILKRGLPFILVVLFGLTSSSLMAYERHDNHRGHNSSYSNHQYYGHNYKRYTRRNHRNHRDHRHNRYQRRRIVIAPVYRPYRYERRRYNYNRRNTDILALFALGAITWSVLD